MPAPPQAAPAASDIDQWLTRCLDNNPSVAGQNRCAFDAADMWQARLDAAVLRARKVLDAQELIGFEKAQAAWEAYFQAEKSFLSDVAGQRMGSIYTNIASGSAYKLVKNRALYVEGILGVFEALR